MIIIRYNDDKTEARTFCLNNGNINKTYKSAKYVLQLLKREGPWANIRGVATGTIRSPGYGLQCQSFQN